jgi:hypothetical protein
MNNCQKYLFTSVLATAALLVGGVSSVSAQVPAGALTNFAALGGTAVTCTGGSIVGDVGISPGITAAYTNTGCLVTGGAPPATNQAAVQARADLTGAYAAFQSMSAGCTAITGSLAASNLAPGVYCVDAVAKTGLLTLSGPSSGVWVLLIDGALTGTNFSVEMAGGAVPCNVFWVPGLAATMTNSALKGSILAGNEVSGSITLTGGSLAGQALASVALTTTGSSVVGCQALATPLDTTAPVNTPSTPRYGHVD